MANLLEQIVGNMLPNGYIYSTASGTEYFYNDGSWTNKKTMTQLSESRNTKMNVSAAKQIAEHNASNMLQIGKTYKLNENSYVYVGRNIFTKNGKFISEQERKSVHRMITEASEVVLLQVPPGYKMSFNGGEYIKQEYHSGDGTSTTWSPVSGPALNTEQSFEITKKALVAIYNYNSKHSLKIGTNVYQDWNGRERMYTFMGDGFSIAAGTNRVERGDRTYNKLMQHIEDGGKIYPLTAMGADKGHMSDLKYTVEDLDEEIKKIKATSTTSTAKEDDTQSGTQEPEKEASTAPVQKDEPPSEAEPEEKPEQKADAEEEQPSSADSTEDSASTSAASNIPDQYKVLVGKKTYTYMKKYGWESSDKNDKLTSVQQQKLTDHASKEINSYNNSPAVQNGERVAIGSKIKKDGTEYTYLGQFFGYVDKFGNRTDEYSKLGSELSNKIKSGETEQDSGDSVQNTDDTQDDNASPEQEIVDVQPAPEASPKAKEVKVKDPEEVQPAEDKEVSENDVQSKVPNGYAIKSTTGKSYVKLNGKWINTETNKVLNSSAASMIERNAENLIDEMNEKYKGKRIPVGQEYTSKKGTKYVWNGTQFVNDKGRSLPKAIAPGVEEKIKQELGITEEEPEVPNTDAQPAQNDSTDTPSQEQQPKSNATVSNINQNRMNQGPASNDADVDPMRHLDSANDGDIDFDEEVPANDSEHEPDENDDTSEQDQDYDSDEDNSTASTGSSLEQLAKRIKDHPEARRITVLIARGDSLSLMAADILLNKEEKEARQIIQSLNSNDNTQ